MSQLLRLSGLFAATMVATAVFFFVLLDGVVMPFMVKTKRVQVPDLREQSAHRSRQRLERNGLRLAVRDSVFSDSVPPGHVVEQSPNPRELIKKGRRVFVDVSRGRRSYQVPDVRGGSLREARLQIAGNQLELRKFAFISSGTVPQGVIVSQKPRAGTRLSKGGAVYLEISSGSPFDPKPVPDLVGVAIAAAEDSLEKYELRLGGITEKRSDAALPGVVLSQDPPAESSVPRHSVVEVTISVRHAPAGSAETPP